MNVSHPPPLPSLPHAPPQRQLMDVGQSCENQNQLAHLTLAADALNDLCNVQMYEKGHPKNVSPADID